MPFVWAIDCHSTLFFYYVSNAAITAYEKETRTETSPNIIDVVWAYLDSDGVPSVFRKKHAKSI